MGYLSIFKSSIYEKQVFEVVVGSQGRAGPGGRIVEQPQGRSLEGYKIEEVAGFGSSRTSSNPRDSWIPLNHDQTLASVNTSQSRAFVMLGYEIGVTHSLISLTQALLMVCHWGMEPDNKASALGIPPISKTGFRIPFEWLGSW